MKRYNLSQKEIREVDREEFERLMKKYSAERDTVIGGKEDAVIGREDILFCLQRAVEEQALPELPVQKDYRTQMLNGKNWLAMGDVE